ncbi:lipid-A-disaccharide synthase [Oscillatoria sp. FACHB-1407]|uniref:lipid-A-disaccharide synthase n=1 Tax=Oscillatoria sp. FACHB-1407 TaxID=2692847 RepID=UPI0016889D13|nr:lipid-A-disaccharide synthase [Oscillatoria sp. FACHB-1407]MBD2460653.1 lipid-A-disaccharide synthase [Oscillatoria sp. FACHB-1407]
MNLSPPIDIVILSNGPGEVTTWVRPVVKALRETLGNHRALVRLSLILSPCPNASGKEVAIAQTYPELDRIQSAEHFFSFLLWGKTAGNWDWRDRGVVLFLGGDQFYTVLIGKRLGYRTVTYGEWDTRWHRWIDHFGVMKPDLIDRAPARYVHKFTVVGDLMADVGSGRVGEWESRGVGESESGRVGEYSITPTPNHPHTLTPQHPNTPTPSPSLIGLLPGSKPAKLAQGLPLSLAIAQRIHAAHPDTRFVIPVAPTLTLTELARFADPHHNPLIAAFDGVTAELVSHPETPYLKTSGGLRVDLWTAFPAYPVLSQCRFCLTTVGANTAELGSLAIPMIVMIPMQQADAMRAWDGLPGLLANLPGVGSAFASAINWWFLRKPRLLAWPNIWAQEAIVPELVGILKPQQVADIALNWLEHPEELDQIRDRLRAVRGEAGAATKLAEIVCQQLTREWRVGSRE